MKKILLLIFVFLCFCFSAAQYRNSSSSCDYKMKTRMYILLEDSLYQILNNNPTIYYQNQTDHSSSVDCSILTRVNGSYMIFISSFDTRRSKRYWGGVKRINFDKADSSAFFSANKAIIDWGLDSLSGEALIMSRINIKNPRSIKDSISVLTDWNKKPFTTRKAVIFSGPDSIEFNRKYHKICLIMRWFSDDNLRTYLPDSIMI